MSIPTNTCQNHYSDGSLIFPARGCACGEALTPPITTKAASEIIRLFYRDYEPGVDEKQREIEAVIARALGASSGLFVQLRVENARIKIALEMETLKASSGQKENLRLTADVVALRAALEVAAQTFERYTKMHAEKGTDEGHEKAIANHLLASQMRQALAADRPGAPLLAAVGKACEVLRKLKTGNEAAIIELRKTLPAYDPSKAVADVMAEVAAALAALAPFAPKAENAELKGGNQ